MPSTNGIPTSAHSREDDDRRASYNRRLKAAGLDPEAMPEDIDEFRWEFARMIHMFINDWHGCPERFCQRNRGCMAPNNRCTNAKPLPPDWQEKVWPAHRAEIYQALKARLAECGEEV